MVFCVCQILQKTHGPVCGVCVWCVVHLCSMLLCVLLRQE